MEKVNLEEILSRYSTMELFKQKSVHDCILDAMKEACRQVLLLAVENIEIKRENVSPDKFTTNGKHVIIRGDEGFFDHMYKVDDKSITGTIDQVE